MNCADGSCAVRHLTRQEKRAEYAHSIENALETHNGLREDLLRMGQQYFEYVADIEGIEEDLHDVWDELIHAAAVLPGSSAEHDRLATMVISMCELGILTRSKARAGGDTEAEMAVLTNGQKLWTDLPFLAGDLHTFWTEESNRLSTAERESLATFTAKLCAAGACGDDLAGCAMWLLEQTFEVDKPLTRQPGDQRGDALLSVEEMLPASVAWMNHCNFKLLRFCKQNVSVTLKAATESGGVSMTDGDGDSSSSFSMYRWIQWRTEMGELLGCGNDDLSKVAREGFEAMIYTGMAMCIEVPGEKQYLTKLFEVLDAEMVNRGGVGCV